MRANKLVGGSVLIAIFCGWAYIALTDAPRLQFRVANGVYSNRCCGSIVLNNGMMTVANQRIGYVIEQDKIGPYLLPKTYVGAAKTGFVVRSDRYALKLRLDDPARPRQVELLDDGPGGTAYPFVLGKGS